MSANARYALLDWDNTLREGFTITAWTKYLCNESVVEGNTYSRLMKQFELHQSGQISYERLASTTTEIYAQALIGAELSIIEELAKCFCEKDDAVFKFANGLFDFFRKQKIDIIIVSGAPQVVLVQYANLFGINEVYGMDIEVLDGKYTGIIRQDFGAKKAHIVQKICGTRNAMPLIAFGDSIADEPLLKAAKYGYFFDKKNEMVLFNGHQVCPLSSIGAMIEAMDSSCRPNNLLE